MQRLELVKDIAAPPERVFAISLDVGVHAASMAASGERVVGGVTAGQLLLGDEVTWRARHLGRSWQMTSRIAAYAPPDFFVDEQVSGPFAVWRHAHYFEPAADGGTVMRDVVDFAAPCGLLGRLAEALVLNRYMTRLIRIRNRSLAAVCRCR
ncbi:MAG: SRPBCC family protein [Stackebrandtia sp.]